VKNPRNRALERKRRREGEAFNRSALLALPFCNLRSRFRGGSRRVGCKRAPGTVVGQNPLFCRGIKVTSDSKLTSTWYSRLRRVGFYDKEPHVDSHAALVSRARMHQKHGYSHPEYSKVRSDFVLWEARVREKYPNAEWVNDWRVSKPPVNSVRKQKRRWFLLNNVVKKLPSSVRTGLVTSDVRLFYHLRQKLLKRGAKHVSLGKTWKMIRSSSIEGKRQWKRRKRKR
jgi:hypothetical protein